MKSPLLVHLNGRGMVEEPGLALVHEFITAFLTPPRHEKGRGQTIPQ